MEIEIEVIQQDEGHILCKVEDLFIKFIIAPMTAASFFRDTLRDNIFMVDEVIIKFGYFFLDDNFILASLPSLPASDVELEFMVESVLEEVVEDGVSVVLEEKRYKKEELLMWLISNGISTAIN